MGCKYAVAFVLFPVCFNNYFRTFRQKFSRTIAWWGTSVEIHSALNRLVREGHLDNQQYDKAVKRWKLLSDSVYLIEPNKIVKEIAVTLPKKYGLCALDSFQLAAALVWCKEKPRNRAFVCYDDNLSIAAEKAGFTVFR